MSNNIISCQPISTFTGAEIHGVDLSTYIPDSVLQQLKQALFDYGVIFFRDQELRPEDHIAMAERFNEIDINRFFKAVDGYPHYGLRGKVNAG